MISSFHTPSRWLLKPRSEVRKCTLHFLSKKSFNHKRASTTPLQGTVLRYCTWQLCTKLMKESILNILFLTLNKEMNFTCSNVGFLRFHCLLLCSFLWVILSSTKALVDYSLRNFFSTFPAQMPWGLRPISPAAHMTSLL